MWMKNKKIFLLTTSILLIVGSSWGCNKSTPHAAGGKSDNERRLQAERDSMFHRLKAKADTAMRYSKTKNMNTDYCILIDFSIHSGKNRLFVWDFANDTIKYSGLCCHGMGRGSTHRKPVYSNDVGSNCSSKGYYKIGIRSYSRWGINVHYKMHGLEPTNNNAYKRIVVLHSHTPVSDTEIYPQHLPLGYSLGCPVVADNLMRDIDKLLSSAQKPVLMWIYE